MKKILLAGAMLLSMSAFSQSYLVLSNGVTLTTDKSGFIYDFGHFVLPYKINVNGGQYLIAEEKLSTVDENGYFYNKALKINKVKGKGQNYLINDDSKLVTVDSKGFYYEFENRAFRKILTFGGNFFTVKSEDKKNPVDLYTVNSTGNYFKLNVTDLNPLDIIVSGGSYFQTKKGVVYTINKDGFVFAKPELKVNQIRKAGGNFFINSENKIFTVSEEGFLTEPALPPLINVSAITKIGANYMLDSDGRLFLVDKAGNLVERTIDHDLRNAKVLSF